MTREELRKKAKDVGTEVGAAIIESLDALERAEARVRELEDMTLASVSPSSMLSEKETCRDAIIDLVKKMTPFDCSRSSDCSEGKCLYCSTRDYLEILEGLEKEPQRGPSMT